MLLAPSVSGLFKWRQFEPEVILMAVGWYLRFSLSYRDVEELLAERGLHADHVSVALGSALRPGNRTTFALEAQTDQRQSMLIRSSLQSCNTAGSNPPATS